MPELFLPDSINITQDGRVSVKIPHDGDLVEVDVGRLELYRFPNPVGLSTIGDNLFKTTAASGDPIPGVPGFEGFGTLRQGFLEMSNVAIVQEMVNLIIAQRAYEFNSRSIQTSDSMLGTATTLKR
jgi:flagellar basal-body rod protein FlgG